MLAHVESWQWLWTSLGLLSIPALVALNAFFVAAEFSLVAIRKTRVEELVKQGVRRSRALLDAMDNLDRSIAASQLGITVASIVLGWVSEIFLVKIVQPLFSFLPDHLGLISAHSVAFILTLSFITVMHVVLGEQFPKTVALQAPDQTSLWIAHPLNVFARLTRPLVNLMNWMCNVLLRMFGFRAGSGEEAVHSVEELLLLIEDTEEAGVIGPEQADIVENVFRLSNKRVRDCMVTGDKMASLELNTPPDKILEAVRKGAHTRMPVYEGDPNNIVGIVNTKDLFYLYSMRGAVVLDDALYPATFLDPGESIANALRLFKKTHRPMALVRDATGTVHGLLTLEDILEEIVGDIEDEHDLPTPKLRRRRRPR